MELKIPRKNAHAMEIRKSEAADLIVTLENPGGATIAINTAS